MSVMKKRLCIFGCDNLVAQGVPLHRFPNNNKQPERFVAWVSAVGEVLKETDPVKIYVNKRICDHHFLPEQKTSGHRLVWNAIPSINLKHMPQVINLYIEEEHSYCMSKRRRFPSTSHTEVSMDNPEPSASTSYTCVVVGDQDYDNKGASFNRHEKMVCPETNTREARQQKNEIRRLRQKNKALKQRLQHIKKAANIREFSKLTEHMNEPARLFTRMQFTESKKRAKGRRFTIDEKVLALSLYKRSPKGYKLMSKLFTLPSKKILKQLLSRVKLVPGINKIIFTQLKDTVLKMLPQDRLCTLIFDEMAITPQINYNSNTDDLVGFENLGDRKTNRFANHVLVFMVKGVKAKFKQPVAYYFTQSLKTLTLKNILIDVITNVQATGLNIIATVCDQCSSNVSVINSLIDDAKRCYLSNQKEWRKDLIIVNNKEIFPLYDVPHLLKGLRNNILNKEMKYSNEGTEKKIKWQYFQWVYEADKTYGELRFLPRLTDEHINKDKIKKMRVKMAAQVLSRSMAVATEHLAARGDVPDECRDLVPFVLLIDKVFDSLNSSTYSIPNGKIYKAAVKRNSPHHKLWSDAVKLLKTVKYIIKKGNANYSEKSVPSVNNFIKTIENFKFIWKLLHEKHSFDAMLTRNFNQDPLENFFGSIRSLGARNVAPNCVGFEGAFKTLLLNNINTNHSQNSNCEEDSNTLLQSLLFIVKENEKEKIQDAPSQPQHIVLDQPLNLIQNNVNASDSGAEQRAYVCGWALSKCLQNVVKSCKCCRDKITAAPSNLHSYIRAKEYNKNKKWLCYPSEHFIACFKDIQEITISFLNSDCHEKNIKERIISFIQLFTDFTFIDCERHKEKLIKYFCNISINIIIYSWCRSVNRILGGKITYDDGDDVVKKSAREYYLKHKKR